MNKIDDKFLLERMDEFGYRDFKLHTYNGIQFTSDYKFALELYESDGVYAISERFNYLRELPAYEILLAYKPDLPFPADINFLNMVRFDITTQECNAEITRAVPNKLLALVRNGISYDAEFKAFYYYCPELLDKFRMQLRAHILSLFNYRSEMEFAEFINSCGKIRVKLDQLLYDYTMMTQPIKLDELDLSMYNPNSQI